MTSDQCGLKPSESKQTDIEIYVRNCPPARIVEWLQSEFSSVLPLTKITTHTFQTECTKDESSCTVLIHEGAVGKHFTSVWFKQNKTPWFDDLACAKSAVFFLQTEVRCANGGWKEGEDETLSWWKLDEEGQALVAWQ